MDKEKNVLYLHIGVLFSTKNKSGQAWWQTPVIPASWGAEVVGSHSKAGLDGEG
jgi:hypothetical protein